MTPNHTERALLEWNIGVPQFRFQLMATTLASGTMTSPSGLPTDVSPIPLYPLADPSRVGMSADHPLIARYPRTLVAHYVAACQPNQVVSSGTRQGVPFCLNFDGTEGLMEVVASINGTSALAPTNFKGEPGSPTSPLTPSSLLPRLVSMYDKQWLWHPGFTVNWSGATPLPVPGLNRLYGRPADISRIYDNDHKPGKGIVEQFVITPHDPKISAYSQATGSSELKYPYIGLMVYEERPEVKYYREMAKFRPTLAREDARWVPPLPELSVALGRPIAQSLPPRIFGIECFDPNPVYLVFIHLTTSAYVDEIFEAEGDDRF